MTDYTDSLRKLLEDALKETGVQLKVSAQELATYTAERAAHLATLVDDPAFLVAVRAERNAVQLRAGFLAVGNADAAQARIIGMLHGALVFLAAIIAAA